MTTVIVGGPHSGVGKTLACERVLEALAGLSFGAIRLTTADGEREQGHDHGAHALGVADAAGICGRGASCGVCETVSTRIPSRIVTSERAILKPGTDTWRLAQAGAVAVAWVIALRAGAPAAVQRAVDHVRERGAKGVVIEGTTAIEWLRPKCSVLVATDPGRRWKSVALQQLGRYDILVRNMLPVPPGDVPAPAAFTAASPLACDLGDPASQAARAFADQVRRCCDGCEKLGRLWWDQ